MVQVCVISNSENVRTENLEAQPLSRGGVRRAATAAKRPKDPSRNSYRSEIGAYDQNSADGDTDSVTDSDSNSDTDSEIDNSNDITDDDDEIESELDNDVSSRNDIISSQRNVPMTNPLQLNLNSTEWNPIEFIATYFNVFKNIPEEFEFEFRSDVTILAKKYNDKMKKMQRRPRPY